MRGRHDKANLLRTETSRLGLVGRSIGTGDTCTVRLEHSSPDCVGWCRAIPSSCRDVREPGVDGVAELWFDRVRALTTARESDEWRASTNEEANFIDISGGAHLVAEEREIFIADLNSGAY